MDRYSEEELDMFVSNLERQHSASILTDDLRQVSNMIRAKSTESTKGLTLYKRWHKETVDEIRRLAGIELVWDKLKKHKRSKRTLFTRLKEQGGFR